MKKLFKKSLACVLAAVMSVSLFAASFAVSAEGQATVTMAASEVTPSTTDGKITVDFAAPAGGNVGAGSAVIAYDNDAFDALTGDSVTFDAVVGETYYVDVDAAANTISIIFVSADASAPASVKAYIALPQLAAGTYNFEVTEAKVATAGAVEDGVLPEDGEEFYTVAEIAPLAIVVAESHTHAYGDAYMDMDTNTWHKACECGDIIDADPVIDMDLKRSVSILTRSTLGVRFSPRTEQYSSYDTFYLEVESQHFRSSKTEVYALVTDVNRYIYSADGTIPEGFDGIQAADDVVGDTYTYFDYTGVTAYEMSLPIKFTIYAVDNGVVVKQSQTWEFSIASRILDSSVGTPDASDAVFVDLINYGTAVQNYFANLESSKGSDLEAYNAVASNRPDYGFEDYQKYATSDSVASVDTLTDVNLGTSNNDNGALIAKGLVIQNNNQIVFKNKPLTYVGTTLDVAYIDSFGEDHSVSDIDVDTLTVEGVYKSYYYDQITLYDAESTVVATLYDANGNLLYTRNFSVASFFAANKSDATLSPIGDALAKMTYTLRKNLGLDK